MSSKWTAMSIFDILGPVMIGPSSSHTAGAVRIGKMGRQILGAEPVSIDLHFYGSLAETYKGHMTDRGVVAGLLDMDVDNHDIKNALSIAPKKKIRLSVHTQTISEKNPNTIEMELTSASGKAYVVGVSVGGGEILITDMDHFKVNLNGKGHSLLIYSGGNLINPERISSTVGDNFITCQLFRCDSQQLAIVHINKSVEKEVLDQLTQIEGVGSARMIRSLYDYRIVDPEPLFSSISEMLAQARKKGKSVPDLVIEYETKCSGLEAPSIRRKLSAIWGVMKEAIVVGLKGDNKLVGGFMSGTDGLKFLQSFQKGKSVSGKILPLALARAIACMEVNGSMGRVVASPMAGSCGVLPGVLYTLAEELGS
jgi:L-serine dehydratase